MTLSGRVAVVRIQDENDEDGLRIFSKAKLTLTDSRSCPKLIITIPGDDDIELDLNDYFYVDESSIPGEVDSIRDDSKGQTVSLMDQKQECTDLMKKMRDYLTSRKRSSSPSARRRSPSPRRPPSPRRRSPSPGSRSPPPTRRSPPSHRRSPSTGRRSPPPRHRSPPPRHRSPSPGRHSAAPRSSAVSNDNKNVNDLIEALHNGNEKDATDIARVLARDRRPVRFALNMINESGNAAPPLKSEPVIPLIKMKLLIESFLTENQGPYDVALLPGTTIAKLKEDVENSTGITPKQQYWFINQELLLNNYEFGVTKRPIVDDKTMLILYVAKRSNA